MSPEWIDDFSATKSLLMQNVYNLVPTCMVCASIYILNVTLQYVEVKLFQKQKIVDVWHLQCIFYFRIQRKPAHEHMGSC